MEIKIGEEEKLIADVVLKAFEGEQRDVHLAVNEIGISQLFVDGGKINEYYFAVESLGQVRSNSVMDVLVNHLASTYVRAAGLLPGETSEKLGEAVQRNEWINIAEVNPDMEVAAMFWDNKITRLILLDPASHSVMLCDKSDLEIEPIDHPSLKDALNLVRVRAGGVQAKTAVSPENYQRILSVLATFHSIQMAGAMKRLLRQTTDYVKQRKQFGRTIGSFQAVQHLLSECYVKNELAEASVQYATWQIGENMGDADGEDIASARKAFKIISRNYFDVAKQCIQIMGGIAFTWETEPHLHFKRALFYRQTYFFNPNEISG